MRLNWKNLHLLSKIGIIILIIGIIPILTVMALDAMGIITTGNLALGTGPLVVITFYPCLVLIIVGVYRKNQKEKVLNKKS